MRVHLSTTIQAALDDEVRSIEAAAIIESILSTFCNISNLYMKTNSICDTKRTWILDDSTVVKGTLLIILTVTGAASLRNASTIEPKAVLIRRFVPEVALILTNFN